MKGAFLVAQMVKNLPAVWETQVQSLGQEDPLEKGMATHSSILGWEIPWTEEPGGLQSMRSQRVRHDMATKMTSSLGLSPLMVLMAVPPAGCVSLTLGTCGKSHSAL